MRGTLQQPSSLPPQRLRSCYSTCLSTVPPEAPYASFARQVHLIPRESHFLRHIVSLHGHLCKQMPLYTHTTHYPA